MMCSSERPICPFRMKYLVALVFLAWPLAAGAQPRSMADCEKVKGDLAYNQCLASFGPPARSGGGGGGAGAKGGAGAVEIPEETQPQRGGATRRGRYDRRQAESFGRRRGGRQSASFDIVNRSEVRSSGETRSSRYRGSRRRS